jgi:hypothetical protein
MMFMQYNQTDNRITFKELFSRHYEAHSTAQWCTDGAPNVIHTVDAVLLPCPITPLFSPDSQFGCSTIASILPSIPFGAQQLLSILFITPVSLHIYVMLPRSFRILSELTA